MSFDFLDNHFFNCFFRVEKMILGENFRDIKSAEFYVLSRALLEKIPKIDFPIVISRFREIDDFFNILQIRTEWESTESSDGVSIHFVACELMYRYISFTVRKPHKHLAHPHLRFRIDDHKSRILTRKHSI